MLQLTRPAVWIGALALLAFAPVADSVSFHPTEGSEATKKFALEGSFELGDISMVVDGQDMSGQIPLDQVSGEFDMGFGIVDHYIKIAEGKPLHLEREYTGSNASFSAMENSESKEDLFEVDGKTVVFKWDAEKGEYTRSVKEGEVEEAKLSQLGIDLDYRSLLPERDVSAGDKWEIEPKKLVTALFFGAEMKDVGDMGIDDPDFAEIADELIPAIEKLFESFKAQCEYVGSREEGETKLGEVKIVLDSKGSSDLSQMISAVLEKQTQGAGVTFEIGSADLGLAIRGEGTLLWDLKKGCAKSFVMDSEVELTLDLDVSVTDPNGGDHSAEAGIEVMGKAKWSME
ncbi:MAG: hypothetical protein IT454_17430 [Planctomycetes bacterium]|nr:hypothetical protein [Planctomycetota bacterium]